MKKCKKIIITMFMLMIAISILFVGRQLSANENSIVQVTFMNNDINADNVDIQAKAQCLEGYKITAMQLDDQPKVDNVTEIDFTATENRGYTVKVYYQSLAEQKELTETFTTTVDSITKSNENISLMATTSNIITTADGYEFDKSNGTITKYTEQSGITKIEIPSEIENTPVTNIGNDAFYGCKSLTEITIQNSVTSIGDKAFYDCRYLTEITIPNSITSIGDSAFYNCRFLKEITIPNSVTSIGPSTFEWCESLKEITIPNSVTSIYWSVFSDCRDLTKITIPNSVTSIGGSTFTNCLSLKEITIPNSVTSLGNYTFMNCSSLTSIAIPNSVTSLGPQTFQGCSSLTEITIPDSVTSLGNYVFRNCSSLTSIAIPNSVTSIGNYAFYGCSSLTSIAIPNSVTSIDNYAFYGCSSLTSIAIPNSVTSLGNYAFSGCSSLIEISIPNSVTSIGRYAFQSCSSLKEITIPNSVTSISTSAFSGCSSLTSITIPNSVTSISVYAFDGCSSLTTAYIPDSMSSENLKSIDLPSVKNLIIMCSNPLEIDIPSDSPILSMSNIANMKIYRIAMKQNIEINENDIKCYEYKKNLFSLDDIFADKGVSEGIFTGTSGIELYEGDDIRIPKDYLGDDASVDKSTQYTLVGTPTSQDTKIEGHQLIIGDDEQSTDLKVQAKGLNAEVKTLPVTIIPAKSLSIKNESQNIYTDGDLYNPQGLVLTVTYNDEHQEDIIYSEENKDDFRFAYNQLDLTTTKQVITYRNFSVEQKLTINYRYEDKVLSDDNSSVNIKGEFTSNSYVTVEKREDTDSELYKDLDDKNIIANYEVKVVGEYQGKLFIVFDVGEENNNKKAYIRHLKKDGTIDEYEETVLAGKVGITVSELSPFVIYIDKEKIDNTPDINDGKSPTIDINDQGEENNVIPVIKGPLVEQKNENQQNNITSQPTTQDNQMIIPYFIILGIGILGVGYHLLTRKQFK